MIHKIKKFLLTNQTTKQTVAKNTFWLFLSEASERLIKMMLIIYAARILGASGWGVFSYAISVGSLLMVFSDIGLSGLITREAIQKKDEYLTFISSALVLKSIALVTSIFLVIFISPLISHIEEARVLFPMIAGILFFDSIRDIGFAINRSIEKMEREAIAKIITNAVVLGLGIFLLKENPMPKSIGLAYMIGSMVGAIMIIIILRRNIKELISTTNKDALKTVAKTALPFAIVTLIGSIMANTDVFMLGIWKNSTEIGLYASAQKVQQFILIIPAMITTAVFPLASRLAEKDAEKFGVVLGKTISLSLLLGIPIVFGGLMLAEQIVPFLFGPGYAAAVPILQILLMIILVSFPLILLSNAIFAYNKQKYVALAYSIGVIVNIALNTLLIPEFGAAGSALATLVSTTIITLVVWKKMKAVNYFEVIPRLTKIIISSLIMIFSILLLRRLGAHLLLNIIFSSLVYFCSLFAQKEPLIGEVKNIFKR